MLDTNFEQLCKKYSYLDNILKYLDEQGFGYGVTKDQIYLEITGYSLKEHSKSEKWLPENIDTDNPQFSSSIFNKFNYALEDLKNEGFIKLHLNGNYEITHKGSIQASKGFERTVLRDENDRLIKNAYYFLSFLLAAVTFIFGYLVGK